MSTGHDMESAVFARCAAERLAELGHAATSIHSGARLGQAILAQDEPVAHIDAVAAFFQHGAKLSMMPTFGFRLGQQTDLRRAGILGYLAYCAPDLGSFLEHLSRYAPLFGETLFFDTTSLSRNGDLFWGHSVRTEAVGQYHEFLAALILSNLRRICQRRIVLRDVWFCHERSSNRDEFEEFFGCKPRFGASRNLLRFAPADLSCVSAGADPALLRILQGCAEVRMDYSGAGRADLLVRVRQRISHRLASGTAALDTVALDLGMSPRTLSRKLSDQGTSYFAILEALRLEMAKNYLSDSDLVLAEIAHLLGYRGLSSFNDAFKRWTGQSPGKFRANL